MMPKISLIIPVYNAASYIEACLASLVAQTMDDIEVLLINDHGEDDSMAIAQRFIDAHPSGKTFRQLATPYNLGPGAARNVGIGAAQGEYIGFVDSDDVVMPDFCEQLYTAAKAHDADIAYCQAQLVQGGAVSPMNNPVIESGEFIGAKRSFFLTHYVTMMWTFLYRRSLIYYYRINFPGTRSAEDSCFLTCALLAAQRIACVDKPLYQYLVHGDSLSESLNPMRYIDKLKSFDTLLLFARAEGLYDANKAELDYIYLKKGYLLSLLTYVYNVREPQPAVLDTLYGDLLIQIPDFESNPHYRADRRLRLLHAFIHRCPRLAIKVLPWYIRKTKMKL